MKQLTEVNNIEDAPPEKTVSHSLNEIEETVIAKQDGVK